MVLRAQVTNFLGLQSTQNVNFVFSSNEGIILVDIMEEYVINPANDFQLKPRVTLSNCNFTAISIVRI